MIIVALILSLLIGCGMAFVLCRYLSYGAEKKVMIYSVSIVINVSLGILFYFMSLTLSVTDTLYKGGYVVSATYYKPWDELVKRTREVRVGTDSEGNSKYKTETYHERVNHPERFVYVSNDDDKEIVCYEDEFKSIIERLSVEGTFVDMHRKYHEKDGDAYRYEWDGDPKHCFTVTTKADYKNYLKGSDNSIFKYHVDDNAKETYGLFDYPKFSLKEDQVTILGYDASQDDISAVQYINGYYGGPKQFRLYLLFYDNQDVIAGEMQRSLWQGGKQNEFVVCLGHKGDSITWCYPFSWSDTPTLEQKTKMYFMKNPRVDISKFAEFVIGNLDSWKPKDFEDFSYLGRTQNMAGYLRLLLFVVFLNVVAGFFIIRKDKKERKRNKM